MDTVTQTAFRDLWHLWQDNLTMGDDPERINAVVREAGEIVARAEAAADPAFVIDFGIAVIDSLARLNIGKGTG